jgi:hypothetical protein
MNILSEQFCKEYNIVHSELNSDGTNPIYIMVELYDGHVLRIELRKWDVDGVYSTVREALENYYLMKNRKDKLKQINGRKIK